MIKAEQDLPNINNELGKTFSDIFEKSSNEYEEGEPSSDSIFSNIFTILRESMGGGHKRHRNLHPGGALEHPTTTLAPIMSPQDYNKFSSKATPKKKKIKKKIILKKKLIHLF